MTNKRKICFIVQRYGMEVNGGAELECRQYAEKLLKYFDVTVLTTKAIDYISWKNEYKNDIEDINGVTVHRFNVLKERNMDSFNAINYTYVSGVLPQNKEKDWLIEQGPYTPDLIQYIEDHKDDYDAFIFQTYLYYTTVMGIMKVGKKAILISLAHDEPYLKFRFFKHVFKEPRAFIFQTDEERELVRSRFYNYDIPYTLSGVGVDLPKDINAERFKKKYKLDHYIIYVGRIDDSKNCPELFEFFKKYKERNKNDLKLVLMGKPVIDIPDDPNIVSLGFVSDQDKFDGILGSELLVLPSKFESLSMVVLEAFSLGKTVLVNDACEVLKGHCQKSKAGFTYHDYEQFENCINEMYDNPKKAAELKGLAKTYIKNYYQWDVIILKMKNIIDYVIEMNDRERSSK